MEALEGSHRVPSVAISPKDMRAPSDVPARSAPPAPWEHPDVDVSTRGPVKYDRFHPVEPGDWHEPLRHSPLSADAELHEQRRAGAAVERPQEAAEILRGRLRHLSRRCHRYATWSRSLPIGSTRR